MNPTDPNSGSVMIECGLPAVVGGIRGGAKLPAMLEVTNLQATPAEAETKEKSNKKGTFSCLRSEKFLPLKIFTWKSKNFLPLIF